MLPAQVGQLPGRDPDKLFLVVNQRVIDSD